MQQPVWKRLIWLVIIWGKRTGTGLREYAFSNVDDGGGV